MSIINDPAKIQQVRDHPAPGDDVVLRGHAHRGLGGAPVTLHSPDGEEVGVVLHHVRHSRDGFSWGYAGSGPAELARCLLITVLGPAAVCATCGGTAQVIYDPANDRFERFDPARHHADGLSGCPNCSGEGFTVQPARYQRFKEQFVAAWPRLADWEITVGEIRAWLAADSLFGVLAGATP